MRKVVVRHMVEIAGGVLLAGLANDMVNKAVDVSKKVVEKIKNKNKVEAQQ